MGLHNIVSSSPTNQASAVATKYEVVNGVIQRVQLPIINGSKTTFGVDSQAYVKPSAYSSKTPISSISSGSLLTSVLTATGFGAMVATVGDLVANPIVKMYQDKIKAYTDSNPDSTLDGLFKALSQVNDNASTSTPIVPSVPSSGITLLDILKSNADSASQLANTHHQLYLETVKNNSKSDNIATLLQDHKDSVNDSVAKQLESFNGIYVDKFASLNDELLSNNSYIDDLNTNFKDAIDKSFAQNQDALSSLNDSFGYMGEAFAGISRTLAIDGVQVAKTDKDIELQDLQIDKHNYHKTVTDVVDMDGNKIASVAPRDLKNIESASTARKHTDQNNFEVTDDDIDTMFTMPDISEIFKYGRLTDRLQTSLDGMAATI